MRKMLDFSIDSNTVSMRIEFTQAFKRFWNTSCIRNLGQLGLDYYDDCTLSENVD